MVSIAQAAPVMVVNSGFETEVLADGAFTNTVTGWVVSGNAGSFNPTNTQIPPIGAPEGQNTLFINSNAGNVSQILTTNLVAETSYVLQVDVCDRTEVINTTPNYLIEFIAGTTTLINDGSSLAPTSGCLTSSINYVSSNSDIELGNALQIKLSSTGGGQVNFDNVRLSAISVAPIPTLSLRMLILLVLFILLSSFLLFRHLCITIVTSKK
jgi:hypothetical protein